MKKLIENKIKFLEKVLEEMKKDYESMEFTTVSIENHYSMEELIYNSQIKVLKQILKESENLTK
jgi:hypothetical protein